MVNGRASGRVVELGLVKRYDYIAIKDRVADHVSRRDPLFHVEKRFIRIQGVRVHGNDVPAVVLNTRGRRQSASKAASRSGGLIPFSPYDVQTLQPRSRHAFELGCFARRPRRTDDYRAFAHGASGVARARLSPPRRHESGSIAPCENPNTPSHGPVDRTSSLDSSTPGSSVALYERSPGRSVHHPRPPGFSSETVPSRKIHSTCRASRPRAVAGRARTTPRSHPSREASIRRVRTPSLGLAIATTARMAARRASQPHAS